MAAISTALAIGALGVGAYTASQSAKAQKSAAKQQAEATLKAADLANKQAITAANAAAAQQAAVTGAEQQRRAAMEQAQLNIPQDTAVEVDLGLPDNNSGPLAERRRRQQYRGSGNASISI